MCSERLYDIIQAPRERIQVIVPSSEPQNAQIIAEVMFIDDKMSQNDLLFNNFIITSTQNDLIILHIHAEECSLTLSKLI